MRKITLFLVFIAVFCNSLPLLGQSDFPNIIVIYTDDQGFGDMQANNPQSKFQTPALDRLAAEGINFTDGHSSSTVCTPSRYSLLTGRYSWRTNLKSGVLGADATPLIKDGETTVASLLKDKGYNTAMVGKWHLGMDIPGSLGNRDYDQPITGGPVDVGFDYFYGIPASMNHGYLAWMEGRYTEVNPTLWTKKKPNGLMGADDNNPYRITPPYDLDRGTNNLEVAEDFEDVLCLTRFTEKSIEWMEEQEADAKSGTPFFIYIPLTSSHKPVIPREDFRGLSGAGAYGDFMLETDHHIETILNYLDESGLAENTLVIVSSDNGPENTYALRVSNYYHDSAGIYRGGKRDIYEGGHRVPFVVRWPAGIKNPGREWDKPVNQTDLMATVAEIVGMDLDHTTGVDSDSFYDVLQDNFQEERLPMVHHGSTGQMAIRYGDWKLIMEEGNNPLELYNLATDAMETQDLYEEEPEIAAELEAKLTKIVVSGRTTPGPYIGNDTGWWDNLTWMTAEEYDTFDFEDATAVIYQLVDYQGTSLPLVEGEYPDLSALGFSNNIASSIQVTEGYQAEVFSEVNFEGNSIIFTVNDPSFIDNDFQDTAASIKVSRIVNSQKKPKGIIFVMTDDQGYGDIDYFYPSSLETPALDALAAESIRLTDFHTGTTCAPTRASLMTGRHINATGVWHTIAGRELLRENEQTIAEVFQANNWNTGIFGKWHLGEGYPFSPHFRGFDLAVIHGAGGIGQGPDYWRNDYYSGIDGSGNPTTLDFYFENGVPVEADRFCTDYFFKRAQEFIQESVDKDEPFFCYIPTNAPHAPFNAPFGGKSGFDGLVENIDDNMAALDAYLEEMGIKDDVLLVYTTDNGTVSSRFGGLRDKKGSEYDGGHNVPCLVRWKNGGMAGSPETGRDETTLTAAMDFFPTFMELCELDKPAGGQPLHGNDLTERLLNPNFVAPERYVVVDRQREDDLTKWKQASVMKDEVEDGVITHKWRLIRYSATSPFELYDFQVDRDTDNDLAANYPEVITELSAKYEEWYDIISENSETYSPFVLNDDFEDELVLHSHSWIKSGVFPPWNQRTVLSAKNGSRISPIRFDKGGTYRFELRRWPREDGGAIDAVSNLAEGTAIIAAQARITIQGVGEVTVPVESGAPAAFIEMEVPAGEATEITSAFLDNTGGVTKGAYYIYISLVNDEISSPLVAYTDCDFGGTAYTFDEGTYDHKDGSFLNDVISSLKVKQGYEVEVLEHAFKEGKSMTFQAGEIACLEDTGLNEKISGIIVRKSTSVATVYQHCNYDGISLPLEIGEYSRLTNLGLENDIISSVKVPSGLKVTLWEHANFRGDSITLTEDDTCLIDDDFDNMAGSAIVAPVSLEYLETSIAIASAADMTIELHPNPVSDILTVKLEHSSEKILYQVLGLDGKVYSEGSKVLENNSNSVELSLKTLSSGIYLLQMMDDNGTSYTQKIVKQ